MLSRRHLLAAATLAAPAAAQTVDLRLPGGPSDRPLTTAFPQKAAMILQRTTPPLLETPMAVFNGPILTPNDRHFVRWHWAFPTEIDPATFRLAITGHIAKPLSLSLADLKKLPRFEITAVNQCAGNSRGLFEPRVAGAQWAHGAMANARWTGVRLRDVLAAAALKPGARLARFSGLDSPAVENAPDFAKSLSLDHAGNGDVMLAWAMNGEDLPLLNGYPLRLIVPGWFSTYWVKMLDKIEILAQPDDNYWMAKAYLVPATPHAHVTPGQDDFPRKPIAEMPPRAFITNIAAGTRQPWQPQTQIGGIAFGGDHGVRSVEVSADNGTTWTPTTLGPDAGRYSVRRFDARLGSPRGPAILMARTTNTAGIVQPMQPNWNPGGYARNVVEAVPVTFA